MKFEKTSGNVFRDLGFDREEAANLAVRAELMREIAHRIRAEKLTQAKAATRLGFTQPQVSALLRGHIEKFTIDRLVNALARMDRGTIFRLEVVKGKRRDPQVRRTQPVAREAATGRFVAAAGKAHAVTGKKAIREKADPKPAPRRGSSSKR